MKSSAKTKQKKLSQSASSIKSTRTITKPSLNRNIKSITQFKCNFSTNNNNDDNDHSNSDSQQHFSPVQAQRLNLKSKLNHHHHHHQQHHHNHHLIKHPQTHHVPPLYLTQPQHKIIVGQSRNHKLHNIHKPLKSSSTSSIPSSTPSKQQQQQFQYNKQHHNYHDHEHKLTQDDINWVSSLVSQGDIEGKLLFDDYGYSGLEQDPSTYMHLHRHELHHPIDINPSTTPLELPPQHEIQYQYQTNTTQLKEKYPSLHHPLQQLQLLERVDPNRAVPIAINTRQRIERHPPTLINVHNIPPMIYQRAPPPTQRNIAHPSSLMASNSNIDTNNNTTSTSSHSSLPQQNQHDNNNTTTTSSSSTNNSQSTNIPPLISNNDTNKSSV